MCVCVWLREMIIEELCDEDVGVDGVDGVDGVVSVDYG